MWVNRDLGWYDCIFYLWCCPTVPSYVAICSWFAYCQCCGGDSNLNADRWVIAYGSKEDLILNAMVGFHDLNDL